MANVRELFAFNAFFFLLLYFLGGFSVVIDARWLKFGHLIRQLSCKVKSAPVTDWEV